MQQAIIYGIASIFISAPWYYAGAAAFIDALRIRRGVFYLLLAAIAVVIGCLNFYFLAFAPDMHVVYQTILPIIQYTLLVALFLSAFRMYFGKLLYVLLMIYILSTSINYLSYLIHLVILDEGAAINHGNSVSYLLCIILGNALVIPVFIRFCKGSLRKAFDMLSNADVLKLCITPILFFIISHLTSTVTFRYAFSTGGTSEKVSVVVVYLLIVLTGLVTCYVTLRMILTSANRAHLMAENKAMERQLAVQSQSYGQLSEHIEQTRIARHDLRHHLHVMHGLLSAGELPRLQNYMEAYTNSLPADGEVPVCMNKTVDVLVRYYLALARADGVRIDVKLALPEDVGIPETDLSVVFGNLFENALNSVLARAGTDRFIRSRCEVNAGKIILVVDNSIGEPLKKGQGIGQQAVRAIAQRHGGSARFFRDGAVYRSAVMLHCAQ